jgi:type I restriction enzyme S subunit
MNEAALEPNAYPTVQLADVAVVQSGITKGRPRDAAVTELPYLRTANVQAMRLDLDVIKTIPATIEQGERHRLQDGDVLVLEGGDADKVGRGWLWESQIPDCLHQNHVFAVRTDRGRLIPRFLAYYINAPQARAYFLACAKQTTNLASINRKNLAGLPVPLPDLSMQQQIVALLDRRLARIAKATVHFDRAEARLRLYRAAVLRDVVAGPWTLVELRETLHSLRNGIFVSRPAAEGPGIPIFRISAVRPMALNSHDIRFAPTSLQDYERYLVSPGDLLFTRYSGNAEYVGACAEVPGGAPRALHPDKLVRGIVNTDVAEPAYLEIACATDPTWGEIRAARKTTAGQVGIAGKQLGAVHVPLPPLADQRRIIGQVKRQISAIEPLAAHLRDASAKADLLKASMLAQAFAGAFLQDNTRAVLVGS